MIPTRIAVQWLATIRRFQSMSARCRTEIVGLRILNKLSLIHLATLQYDTTNASCPLCAGIRVGGSTKQQRGSPSPPEPLTWASSLGSRRDPSSPLSSCSDSRGRTRSTDEPPRSPKILQELLRDPRGPVCLRPVPRDPNTWRHQPDCIIPRMLLARHLEICEQV